MGVLFFSERVHISPRFPLSAALLRTPAPFLPTESTESGIVPRRARDTSRHFPAKIPSSQYRPPLGIKVTWTLIPDSVAESLARYDTCILADAVDRLGLHLNTRGFTRPGLQCVTGQTGSVAGYAATARIRSSEPPITGHTFFHHTEWWAEISRLPAPRMVVIEDIDEPAGLGACVGQVAAAAFKALHCAGAVTNGSCRDVAAVGAMGFGLFAAHLSPSRAYAHLVDHSRPVGIFGLLVKPGDLLVADCHGVLSIPPEHAPQVCAIAADLASRKRTFVEFCASGQFSISGMEEQFWQLHP